MNRSLRMAGLMLLAACDISSGNLMDADTADTASTTLDTGYEPWSDMATQVGSEGIFGCLVQSIVPIAGDAVPDGFTQTPSDAYANFSGVWSGDFLTHDDSVIPANLDLQAPEVFRLVMVVPATGCSVSKRRSLAMICGCLITSERGKIGAQGTCSASRRSIHSFVLRDFSTSAVWSRRSFA